MQYAHTAIAESEIPRAAIPLLQHLVTTYVSEVNKLNDVWLCFSEADLDFRPHERSPTVRDIMKHELLSERRFFAEFLGMPEMAAENVLQAVQTPKDFAARAVEMAWPRMKYMARQNEAWWLTEMPFFDVVRQKIWILWRRMLHTAHHRTQVAVYLRMIGKPVPSIYGPTADESWQGADPTISVEAAKRR